jgi:hypothetical protein
MTSYFGSLKASDISRLLRGAEAIESIKKALNADIISNSHYYRDLL